MKMRELLKVKNIFSIKILALLVSLFILLSIAFCYISSIAIINSYEVILNQSMSQQLKVVEGFFRYPENIINILSQNKDLPRYKPNNRLLKNDILSLFESVIIPDSRISNIYFVSNYGETISYKFAKDPITNLSGEIWFKKTLEGKTQFTWFSHKSEFTDDDVISCTRRVVDEYNKPIGVIGLDIELFKLSELVRDKEIGKNGYFMILDSDNKIIATKNYDDLGQILYNNNLNNRIDIDSPISESFTIRMNNEKFKCKVSTVKKLPWKILNTVSYKEITWSIAKLVILFIIFAIVSFTIASIMCFKNKVSQELNQKLKDSNKKLKEYASTIEKLATLQERTRMARDVHDTLGQTLSILITLLQISVSSCKKDSQETEKNLNNAIKITREGLNEVRRSISGLVPENLIENNLFDALQRLINDFQHSGMNVELSVNTLDQSIDNVYSEVIYRICQESLTNSVKHGKATEANIIIKFTDDFIKLFIFDNGIGCKDINIGKGLGLRGMKQRIEKVNGDIKFGSSDENGFNVHVELPLIK